jgi:mono/diheme cytochrome c family protein
VADELMVLDAATHAPTAVHYTLLSGSNPTGLAVTPDGTKAYVVYENSTFASVIDLSAYAGAQLPWPGYVPYQLVAAQAGQGANVITSSFLERDVTGVPDAPPVRETAQVPLVDADPVDPVLRRGRVLFASSSPVKWPTLSGNREAACASCHPNGGNDGTVWGTMEGERRTVSLWGGTSGRGWLHASGTHADSTVFATTIVQQRLGGTGLSPDDVHALAGYVAHGIPRLQSPVVDASLAARGQAVFQERCAACHQGDSFTSGAPDPASLLGGGAAAGPGLSDIGSATEWAGATLGTPFTNLFPPDAKKVLVALRGDRALGGGDVVQQTLAFTPRPDRARGAFKAPSLVGVWDDPLYFHDGRAATLDEAVRDMASRVGPAPSDDEVAALVAYLKTL